MRMLCRSLKNEVREVNIWADSRRAAEYCIQTHRLIINMLTLLRIVFGQHL